jgi:hypothetical protein
LKNLLSAACTHAGLPNKGVFLDKVSWVIRALPEFPLTNPEEETAGVSFIRAQGMFVIAEQTWNHTDGWLEFPIDLDGCI